jgi:protein-L-isoaspartate(D-aspartate) O-methyltransferase
MDRVEQAMQAVPREAFLPEEIQDSASEDRPLPIGYGQTNSQPSTVRLMLEWLDVKKGDKILDVGSGSGWTTALLAHLTGEAGWVEATEKVPQLILFAEQNCERLGIENVTFHQAIDTLGWSPEAPYDRILVSASADELPAGLVQQLKPGGKMVIPVDDEILEVETDSEGQIFIVRHPGFSFVPLL